MSKAAELLVPGKDGQAFRDILGTKINPADYTTYEAVLSCEIEQKLCLVLALVSLNCNTSIDLIGTQLREKIFGKKVSSYHRHFIGDPLIAHRIVFPEVLVRIKSHKDELRSEQFIGTSIYCLQLF